MQNNDPGSYAFLTQGQKDALNSGTQVAPPTATPTSPTASPYVNPNANMFSQPATPTQPPPATPPATNVNVNVGQQDSTSAKPAQTNSPTQSTATLPFNGSVPAFDGSVVNLLNSMGQPSDFASRSKMAGDMGIQDYKGTAAQNLELAKKFQEFHASKGQTQAPATNPRTEINDYTEQQLPQEDAQQNFFDEYMKMNPVVSQLYNQINHELSSSSTQQTFAEMFKTAYTDESIPAGLPGDSLNESQVKLMNIKNIMDGTESDIRDEITKVGGFATESQVQALATARNKTLLKQANVLQQSMALKTDYVDHLMQFSQLDRTAVDKAVDRKIGLTEKLATLEEKMTSAAKDNYQKIVDKVGYAGLAKALTGDTQGMKLAEQSLGLSKGALTNPKFLEATKPPTTMTSSIQEYEYAKAQGYTGTFNQYQNEDANRKAKVAGAGVSGLTAAQINATVNAIAGNFDNEQVVKDYNTASNSLKGIQSIGSKTKSPTDDMAFIYAFAKIMDPNSVVREGEYKTVQDYGQALVQKAGLNLKRITDNTNFLTEDAKTKMLTTLEAKVGTMKQTYNQVSREYQRQIDDAYAGKPRQITNYITDPSTQTMSDGSVWRKNPDGSFTKIK